jgi:hypothetical protein
MNVNTKQNDDWVRAIRAFEGLMKSELQARHQRYFTLEKMIRELRRNVTLHDTVCCARIKVKET